MSSVQKAVFVHLRQIRTCCVACCLSIGSRKQQESRSCKEHHIWVHFRPQRRRAGEARLCDGSWGKTITKEIRKGAWGMQGCLCMTPAVVYSACDKRSQLFYSSIKSLLRTKWVLGRKSSGSPTGKTCMSIYPIALKNTHFTEPERVVTFSVRGWVFITNH